MTEDYPSRRLEKLLGSSTPPKAEDTIALLKEKEKLDKDLFKLLMSESIRVGGAELLAKDGVIVKANGKAYISGESIENVYAANNQDLEKKGLDITKVKFLSLAKVALEAKAFIYVLGRDSKGDDYAYKITPLGVSKVDHTYISILYAIAKRKADKHPEGYA